MAEDFSDAPLTVDGVTVKPSWPWSREYRAQVAAELRATSKSSLPPGEAERRYVEWYAQKHDLSVKEARLRVKGCGE